MMNSKKLVLGLFLFLSLGSFGCASGDSGRSQPDGNLFLSHRVLNIAHRGGGDLAPESTLGSFQNALEVGADVLEVDLHSTSDGVLVCMHDAQVDRTTDGSGHIKGMTFAELRSLDAGYHFSPDGGQTYPDRGTGVVVPTFEEVLEAFPESYILLEIKQAEPPIVDPVLDMIARYDAADRIVLASVTDSIIAEVREKAPEQMTAFGATEMISFVTMTDEALEDYQPPCQFMQPPHDAVSDENMARINSFEIKVHAWTVNDEAEMRRLVDLGVAGIITDDPVLLESVLDDMGQP